MGTRFGGAGVSVSESLLFNTDNANETALFRRVNGEHDVFGRLRIGAEGDNIVKGEDGTVTADENLERLV